jgi:hypothetical protein
MRNSGAEAVFVGGEAMPLAMDRYVCAAHAPRWRGRFVRALFEVTEEIAERAALNSLNRSVSQLLFWN